MKKSITINGKLVTRYFKSVADCDKWLCEVRSLLEDKSLEGEVWKSIEGYSRYEASNFGRVMSINYKNSGARRLVVPSDTKGYLQSMFLADDNKYYTRKVHYLIALAFLGKRGLGYEVNHKNGNKHDNSINNLEYVTRSENCQHAFDTGLQIAKRGELNGMAKLTREQVEYLREKKKEGGRYWGRNELAKEFGISAKHLQKIVNNHNLWI